MFREVARKNRALDYDECVRILKETKRGVLAVTGDGGYPYAVPLNHFYNEEDGCLYFHSGKTGHKTDALMADAKASFCVLDEGEPAGDWSYYFRSVIVFGRIDFIEDRDEIYRISRLLSLKFTDDEAYIAREIEHYGPETAMFVLRPEHVTGKRVHER